MTYSGRIELTAKTHELSLHARKALKPKSKVVVKFRRASHANLVYEISTESEKLLDYQQVLESRKQSRHGFERVFCSIGLASSLIVLAVTHTIIRLKRRNRKNAT